jgi:hypothetical protein
MRAYQRRRRGAPEADRYTVDPHLPVKWQEQTSPGHEARVWASTAITRRLSDGYVNATAMCQANGKRWFDYERIDRTQDYIKALHQDLGWMPDDPGSYISSCLDAPELVVSIKGGTPDLQGTWIHPRLAIDLARWISPAFAVWMDGWFLESLSRPQPALQPAPLRPGIHVVANSPRHARWLWAQAVEAEVSASLMRSVAERTPAPYQAHLLPSPD